MERAKPVGASGSPPGPPATAFDRKFSGAEAAQRGCDASGRSRRKPPFLVRAAPRKLKTLLYHRYYYPIGEKWNDLFASAPLSYARGVTMELKRSDVMHGAIAFTGFYERELTQRIVHRARQGGLLIDVGANVGYFTLIWLATNPFNRSIAFEPSPRNSPRLRRNLEQNGFGSRVDVHEEAAGARAAEMDFELGPPEQTGWGGLALAGGDTTVRVPVVRIDDVVDPSDYVAALKIDVEGAEAWVLKGCERLLRERRVGEIYFEQNFARMEAIGIAGGEAARILASLDYRVERVNRDEWVAFPD